MRPQFFVTSEKVPGLCSLEELQERITTGLSQQLWLDLLAQLDDFIKAEVFTPFSSIPGRPEIHAKQGNRDYGICDAAGQRIMYAALAALITKEQKYVDEALRQLEAVFDRKLWGEWCDLAHGGTPVGEDPSNIIDLRTGMFARDISLAYDWLYNLLSEKQRQWIVDGLEEWAFKPFFKGIEDDRNCLNSHNNWLTVVVGGIGIAAMILGDDYPRSQEMFEYSWPRMVNYLNDAIGPLGESNESPGYAGSTQNPVIYFETRRYQTLGRENVVGNTPFPEHCHWMMNMTVPPGYIVAYGDGGGKAPMVPYFAAIAAASRDPYIQWYYLNHISEKGRRNHALELLWYDSSLEPVSPEGKLPKGGAFPAFSGCIASRTEWDANMATSVVMSKAGNGIEGHGNHDAGQVCIDAYGKPLIVDLGSPPYPPDYFTMKKWNYYPASVFVHNIFQFNNQEMYCDKTIKARIVTSQFDDDKGGWWIIDSTDLYEGARKVRRLVVHLFPAIVTVYDIAELDDESDVSLRWHTATKSIPDDNGNFTICNDGVSLISRVVSLDNGSMTIQQKHHAYKEPFNLGRTGEPLPQKNEPFVDIELKADKCRLLTLFAATAKPIDDSITWQISGSQYSLEAEQLDALVSVDDQELVVKDQKTGKQWCVSLDELTAK